jgi:hypothetical protein
LATHPHRNAPTPKDLERYQGSGQEIAGEVAARGQAMSQDTVYAILSTFGPSRSTEIQKVLGLSQAAVYSAPGAMKKHGEVAYMNGKGRTGRQGIWWVV